jgi:predicted SprT family Zn-dependent metalloprotease
MRISLFTTEIPVNYASEFREIFETTTYNWERRIQCVLSLEMTPEIEYDCSCQTPYLTRSGHERRESGGSRYQDERTASCGVRRTWVV